MSPVTASTIGSFIREQREQAKISMRQLAQAAGVSNPYLSQVERGLRRPSADILQQIAKGLRISAEALYVQAGILDDRPADTSVADAVMTDPELTERQKQMLIEIYESFRKEVRADAEARATANADLGSVLDAESSAEPDAVGLAGTYAAAEPGAVGLAGIEAAEAQGWRAPDEAASGAGADADAQGEPAPDWPVPGDGRFPVCGTTVAAAAAGQTRSGPSDEVSAATATR